MFFSDPPDATMIVPDVIRKCVVFVGYRSADGGHHLAGTGFLVARPFVLGANPINGTVHNSFTYLLTAKHVLDSLAHRGVDEVLIRFNYRDGIARWVSSRIADWQYHPTEPSSVDVALFNISGFADAGQIDHGVYPIAGFATPELIREEEIGIGEETFIVGMFVHHHGNTKNIPIVRIGNIAAMPEEQVVSGIGAIDAYLVEARSIGGLSGSPVFVNLGLLRVKGGIVEVVQMHPSVADRRAVGRIYLLGLMHGHYDEQHVNMGIGIVVPASRILEVVNQEAILETERQARENHESGRLPVMDSLPDEEQSAPFTQSNFERGAAR